MIRTSTTRDIPALVWFKSSYSSSGDGNDCLEVATVPGIVRVRDSKDIEGPHLALAPQVWMDFVVYASEN